MAERVSGHVQVFDTPSVTPYWIAPYGTATARYWIHSGIANTYADDGTTRTDITGSAFTGAVDDRFTGGAFNGLFIINNGIDQPKYWDGNTANNLATLTVWDSNWSEVPASVQEPLDLWIANQVGDCQPHTVGWSAAADPGTLPTTYDPHQRRQMQGMSRLVTRPTRLLMGWPFGEVFLVTRRHPSTEWSTSAGSSFSRSNGCLGILGCWPWWLGRSPKRASSPRQWRHLPL